MNRKIALFVILIFVLVSGLVHNAYANEYISEEKLFASSAIDQRAIDVAIQLELYLEAHTDMTLQDLKNDVRFNELAVQQVGETGYTYLIVHETGILEFHPDPNIRGGSYNNFKERFPVIWNIIDETLSSPECVDSSGFYDWEDINNIVREKYTYHRCLNYKTTDGYTFFIGASTYLDEYETSSIDAKTNFNIFENNIILYLIIVIGSILLTLFVLHKYNITITNKLTKKIIIQFTIIAVVPIILIGRDRKSVV